MFGDNFLDENDDGYIDVQEYDALTNGKTTYSFKDRVQIRTFDTPVEIGYWNFNNDQIERVIRENFNKSTQPAINLVFNNLFVADPKTDFPNDTAVGRSLWSNDKSPEIFLLAKIVEVEGQDRVSSGM